MADREKVVTNLEKALAEMQSTRICAEDVLRLEDAAKEALALLEEQDEEIKYLRARIRLNAEFGLREPPKEEDDARSEKSD